MKLLLASVIAALPFGATTIGAVTAQPVLSSAVTGGCDMDGVSLVCSPSTCAVLACNTYITVQDGVRYYICACNSGPDSIVCCQLGKRFNGGAAAAVGICNLQNCNEAFPNCVLSGSGTSGDPYETTCQR